MAMMMLALLFFTSLNTSCPFSARFPGSFLNLGQSQIQHAFISSIPSGRTLAIQLYEKKSKKSQSVISANQDGSFVRFLVSTTSRHQSQIDKIIAKFLKIPKGKFNHLIENSLRIAVCELLFSRSARHGVVYSVVESLRTHEPSVPSSLVGLVNAVLRKVSVASKELRESMRSEDVLSADLMRELQQSFGVSAAKHIAEAMTKDPPLDLSLVEPTKANILVPLLNATVLPTGGLRCGTKGAVSSLSGYAAGYWWVQDPAATAAAKALLSALPEDKSTIHCVDVCAAPGGKTAQLLANGIGLVTAVDSSLDRMRLLTINLRRLGFMGRCHTVHMNALKFTPSSGVDAVLVDPPCSATGTGRRNPDVLRKKLHVEGSDVFFDKLLQQQRQICLNALSWLSTGGVLTYSVCSLLTAEGEDQAQNILDMVGEGGERIVELLPIRTGEVPGFDAAITPSGCLRILPGCLGGDMNSVDGFFVARFRKL